MTPRSLTALCLCACCLCAFLPQAEAAYTEFYAQTTGSNLNAGSTTSDSASLTYASGTWVSSTGVFTVASGDPVADGVAVGDFASVYADGASTTTLVGRVTARSSTTITVSTTAKSGSTSDGTSNRTLKIGGAWKGPNGSEGFPFDFVAAAMTNASSHIPRVNLKAGTYSVTSAVTHSLAGPVVFQGYSSTVADGGRWTLDGGTSGASYVLLTVSGANCDVADTIIQNNGATSSSNGFNISGTDCTVRRCVVNNVRGSGFNIMGVVMVDESESYACNQSNTANLAGFVAGAAGVLVMNSLAHDNSGSNGAGFRSSVAATFVRCIADTNGGKGFDVTSASIASLVHCVAYNNTGDGIAASSGSPMGIIIQNCILVKNGGYGINLNGAARNGSITCCAFGAGTEANTSGTINAASGVNEDGSITLGSNASPFADAANGDFDLNTTSGGGAALRGLGRGTYTQTASSYTGTRSYPDVGAAQHQETGGGSSEHSFILAQ